MQWLLYFLPANCGSSQCRLNPVPNKKLTVKARSQLHIRVRTRRRVSLINYNGAWGRIFSVKTYQNWIKYMEFYDFWAKFKNQKLAWILTPKFQNLEIVRIKFLIRFWREIVFWVRNFYFQSHLWLKNIQNQIVNDMGTNWWYKFRKHIDHFSHFSDPGQTICHCQ